MNKLLFLNAMVMATSSAIFPLSRFLFFILITGGAFSHAQEKKEVKKQPSVSLEERIVELEKRQAEMYAQTVEHSGQVKTFFENKVSFGGFFDTALTHLSGPDMKTSFSANSHILGINLAAEYNEKLRFVAQFLTSLSYSLSNPNNNPYLTNPNPPTRQFGAPTLLTLVAQGYAEYSMSTALNIQTGLGYVPFGQAFQQREPALLRRRGGPQMSNSLGVTSVGIAFPLWMGVHLHGTFSPGESRWGYNLYSFSPSQKTQTLGVGTRLWWAPSEGLTLGVSSQHGEQIQSDYSSYGIDASFQYERFGLTVEYAYNALSDGDSSPESYYIEPYYTFADGHWAVYAVADYLNNPNLQTSTSLVADPFKQWQFGGGVNWLPLPFVRYRLGFLSHDYIGHDSSINGQNRDYHSAVFSCSVTF